MAKELTLLEKAAICLAAVEGFREWRTIYNLAHGIEPTNKDKDDKYISVWKNRPLTKDYFEKVSNLIKFQEQKVSLAKLSKKDLTEIDFTNRDEFIAFVNSQVHLIADNKQRLDYLKILADLQRFKETKQDETNEIQRFYSPLTCCYCVLYKKELE